MEFVKHHKFTGTWLGRKGTQHTYHFNKSTLGPRVIVQVWDSGEAEIHAIKGDARRVNHIMSDVVKLNAAQFASINPAEAALSLGRNFFGA